MRIGADGEASRGRGRGRGVRLAMSSNVRGHHGVLPILLGRKGGWPQIRCAVVFLKGAHESG